MLRTAQISGSARPWQVKTVVVVMVVAVVVVVDPVADVVVVIVVVVRVVMVVVVAVRVVVESVVVVVVGNANWLQTSCVIKSLTRAINAGSFESANEGVTTATSGVDAILSKCGHSSTFARLSLNIPLIATVTTVVPFAFISSAVLNAASKSPSSLGSPSVINSTTCGTPGLRDAVSSVLTTVNAVFQFV